MAQSPRSRGDCCMYFEEESLIRPGSPPIGPIWGGGGGSLSLAIILAIVKTVHNRPVAGAVGPRGGRWVTNNAIETS